MAGSAAADFTAFYEANRRRLVAQLLIMVGDRREAEDAAQEAFLRAWRRWPEVARCSDAYPWVFTVAHRVAISRWRRAQVALRARHRLAPRASVEGAEVLVPDIVKALRQLPAAQQRALVLRYIADLPVAEIAAVEGVPEGTVKARLARGRAALKPLLEERDDDGQRVETRHRDEGAGDARHR